MYTNLLKNQLSLIDKFHFSPYEIMHPWNPHEKEFIMFVRTLFLSMFILSLFTHCDNNNSSQKTNPCKDVTCDGHGACVVADGNASCDCDDGYYENNYVNCLETNPDDPCAGIACDGHGACILDVTLDPMCVCDDGYHLVGDTHCIENDPDDPCVGVTCSDHGTCMLDDVTLDPMCACDQGYLPVGLTCVEEGTCGDGVVDDGEECDDGNDNDHDGCNHICEYSCHTRNDCVQDNNTCTVNQCVEVGNGFICLLEIITGACDDGNACTTGDVCSGGACAGTPKTCSADGNVCTDDSCNTATGLCEYTNNTASCEDGNPCTNGDICSNGACVAGAGLPAWYLDTDADTFGSPASTPVCAATQPGGYADNRNDCCDSLANVRPNQIDYFSTAYTCGSSPSSFDYNCTGTEEPQWTATGGACVFDGFGACTKTVGWEGNTAPACGNAGTWVSDCSNFGCTPVNASRTQSCR